MESGKQLLVGHKKLRVLLKCLGYEIDLEGICNGFTGMYIQAAALGKQKEFTKKYSYLCDQLGGIISTEDKLSVVAADLKNKLNNLKDIKDEKERQFIIDLFAFIDGIAVHQDSQISLLSSLPIQKEGGDVYEFTESNLGKEHGGIVNVFSEARIYTDKELRDFLEELYKLLLIAKNDGSDQLTVSIRGARHVVALDVRQDREGWQLIDINDKDFQHRFFESGSSYFGESHMTWQFVSILKHAIAPRLSDEREYSGCTIEIYTTNHFLQRNREAIQSALAALRQVHPIDKAQCERMDEDKFTLAHYAARCDSKDFLEVLAANGADFNCRGGEKGLTPVHFASMFGKYHLITTLAKHGANLLAESTDSKFLIHPTSLPLAYQQWKTMAMLLANIKDINELNVVSKNFLRFGYKEELTAAFIEILKEEPQTGRQLALDVIHERNALGQLLNETFLPTISFLSLFKRQEYEGRQITDHVQRIVKALSEIATETEEKKDKTYTKPEGKY